MGFILRQENLNSGVTMTDLIVLQFLLLTIVLIFLVLSEYGIFYIYFFDFSGDYICNGFGILGRNLYISLILYYFPEVLQSEFYMPSFNHN